MGVGFKKPRPKLLDKRDQKAAVNAEDRAENAKVRARSGGCCEVRYARFWAGALDPRSNRCGRPARHIHHLRSGIGVRNRGNSIKAKCKLHVCERHHEDIHGRVLVPVNQTDRYDAATIRYERVR